MDSSAARQTIVIEEEGKPAIRFVSYVSRDIVCVLMCLHLSNLVTVLAEVNSESSIGP